MRPDQYEIFISYARSDNIQVAEGGGWITHLRDLILLDHRRFSTEPLQIFFDTADIRDMDDWEARILRGLRESCVFLACLSPNYLLSKYCRKEWDEYRNRLAHVSAGLDSIAIVRLAPTDKSGHPERGTWLAQMDAIQQTDLHDAFPTEAPGASGEIGKRVALLGESLWRRVRRARRSATVPGNVRCPNPHFVGRFAELKELHSRLSAGAAGTVVVLNGFGGQGKTELAVAYAHQSAYAYPAGIWMLDAEGKKEMLPLLGELAGAPEFQFEAAPTQTASAEQLGRAVLARLVDRARDADDARLLDEPAGSANTDGAAAALIILDNVDQPALLSASQLVHLNHGGRVRILATTRLGAPQLGGTRRFLEPVPVESLDVETAVALIREHQPPRGAEEQPAFVSQAEASAALDIARDLGGFALAIEQVAVHLGLNPSVKPSAFLKGLRERGLVRADQVAADLMKTGQDGQILHREKLLRAVLHETLDWLGPPAPAVTMGQTLLETVRRRRDRAPARTALEFAARLSPDVVPWPWLKELTVRFHPDLAEHAEDEPDPWDGIQRKLEGLRLLSATNIPEYARMHRMISAHLQPASAGVDIITASFEGSMDAQVRDFLVRRTTSLAADTKPPPLWELDALIENLPRVLKAGCRQRIALSLAPLASAARRLSDKVVAYRGAASMAPLLEAVAEVTHRFADQSAQWPSSDRLALDAAFQHAMSLAQMGELAANEGDGGRAQQLIDEACVTLERLVEAAPEEEAWQRNLSVSYEKQGDLALRRRAMEEAVAKYAAALEISRQIAARHPEGVHQQNELAESILKMGEVARDQGRTDEARRFYEDALQIRRKLLEIGEPDANVEKGVCVILSRLARMSLEEGRLDGVAALISECVSRSSRLVKREPDNLERQKSLSFHLLLASDFSQATGDLDEAYRLRDLAGGLIAKIAHSNPRSLPAQTRLLDIAIELGELAVKRVDPALARQHFEIALHVAMPLAVHDGLDRVTEIYKKLEALQTSE